MANLNYCISSELYNFQQYVYRSMEQKKTNKYQLTVIALCFSCSIVAEAEWRLADLTL